jgi:hypothetical protein
MTTRGLRELRPVNHMRRQQLVSDVPNVETWRNLAKLVAAVTEVHGSETAEVLVTQNLITHGQRAFRPAKHERSSTQVSFQN